MIEEDEPEDGAVDLAPLQEMPAAPAVANLAAPSSDHTTTIQWSEFVGIVWLTGSLAWFTLAALRTFRFHRMLRYARPAPNEVREEAKRWACGLGMRSAPAVWFVPGRVSPLLWWLGGRPHLYLPSELWPTLDVYQRTALLLHELAHLRRGDQWVRLMEMITTSLYWWHPILWLARHELREAEEQCCDAWVVWALPGAGRNYALALVETLDFLSETRTPLPAAASGLGQVRNLRRRLSMIMRGTTPRRMGWVGFVAVLGAAALLLPLVPTLAQDPPSSAQEQEARARRQQAEAAVQRAEAEVRKARAEAELARAQVQQAENNARRQPDRAEPGEGQQPQSYVVIIQDSQGREVRRIRAQSGQTIRVPGGDGPRDRDQPERGRRFGGGPGGPQPGEMQPGPGGPPGGLPRGGGGPPGVAPAQMGGAGKPGGAGQGGMRGGGPGAPMLPGGQPPGQDQEQRLRNIERRLEEVMRTMERMMRDQERRQPQLDRPRRESREEQDIKVRPSTRSRTPTPGAQPLPAEGPLPPVPSAAPTGAGPETPPPVGAAPSGAPPTPERPKQ
jgi:beta-lactamase regulating signal transducer with metallopeptidase domain